MPNRQVKIGVTADDLEENGVEYERGSFLPQIPDYLGYILGLLIVWLIYTGYIAAVETVREPIAKISEQAEVFKEQVELMSKSATPAETSSLEVPRSSQDLVEVSSDGWWYSKLELVNQAISTAAEYVSNKLYEMFPSQFDEEEYTPPDRQRASRESKQISSF